MKKFLKLIVMIFCMGGLFPVSAQQWLVMGFDDYPPFTGKDGSPRVAVQMLTRALERLGYKVDMIPLGPGQFSQVFTNDDIQISPALWHDESREEIMLFTKPIFENRLVLAGKKGSNAETLTLKDLAGKTLGVVDGYAYGKDLAASPAELVMGKSEADLMKKLSAGEVDYILTSELLMIYALRAKKHGFTEEVEVSKSPLFTRPLHFAVKKSTPHAKKIVKQLDEEIEKMLVDGTYYEILGINRIVTDVNGDGKPEVILQGDPANTLNPEEVFYFKGGEVDIPVSDMEQWFMVDGKFYKTLEEIPEDKRKKMNQMAEKQIEFSFKK